jgi:hypothetical protein
MARTIHIHAAAPPKPPPGAACNGCGVCCLAEPCPVGMLASRKRRGACDLLRWDDDAARYHCALMAAGASFIRPRWLAPLALRLARRMIAAGQGCDSDISLEDADPATR